MKVILTFILNHCLYLFEKYGFRFVDSLYSKSFGGDAYVTLESESMRMIFTYDRAQLLLEFSSKKKKKSNLYSIDLISQFITGKVEYSALLDARYARFLLENMEKIVDAFSEENFEQTLTELNKLEKQRSKRMFG
ncbi:MAG: hypothetical protein PVH61_42295 [Candidatus Aminicenantes bacterium]|jgi:hypothetical protein